MKTIWKFPFSHGLFELSLSADADLLGVQVQNGSPLLYVLQGKDGPKRFRQFAAVHTGGNLPNDFGKSSFIGTAMCNQGAYVLHLFEITGTPHAEGMNNG